MPPVFGPVSPSKIRLKSWDRKSTRLNSSHRTISYAVFCLKKKNTRISASIATFMVREDDFRGVRKERDASHHFIPNLYVLLHFFSNDTATTKIYTLSLHDALPISASGSMSTRRWAGSRRSTSPITAR